MWRIQTCTAYMLSDHIFRKFACNLWRGIFGILVIGRARIWWIYCCMSFMWNRLTGLKGMQSAPIIHKCARNLCVNRWKHGTFFSGVFYTFIFAMWKVFVSKLSCLLLSCNTLILYLALLVCLHVCVLIRLMLFFLSLVSVVCFSACVLIDLNE